MKKYVIQLFIVCAVVFSALKGQAQPSSVSTYSSPYVGATHQYTITGNSGDTFTWTVTSDAAGTTPAPAGDFTFINGTTSGSTVSITWNSGSVNKTYYLQVVEKDNNGCTNKRALTITPVANAFDLFIADVTGVTDPSKDIDPDPTKNGIATTACATPPTPSTDASGKIIDNNGTTVLQYKIWIKGTTNTWSFDYAITGTNAPNYDVALKDRLGNSLASAGDKSKTGVQVIQSATSLNDYCILTLTVTNKPGEIQTFKVDITNAKDVLYSTSPATSNFKSATHTILAMPNTSSISGN